MTAHHICESAGGSFPVRPACQPWLGSAVHLQSGWPQMTRDEFTQRSGGVDSMSAGVSG